VDGDENCAGADGSEGMPFCTIAEAVSEIGAGQKGVVVLHAAADSYGESITVAGNGSMIAFIGAPGEEPVWQNSGANASLRADDSAVVFAHKIAFRGSQGSALALTFGGNA